MRYRILRSGKPLIILTVIAALGWIVMLLWNAVMPAAFASVRSIDYLQAVGLLVLSRILFGGFRGGGGWRRQRHWRRWESMTPEEREQFKQAFLGRYKRPEEQR